MKKYKNWKRLTAIFFVTMLGICGCGNSGTDSSMAVNAAAEEGTATGNEDGSAAKDSGSYTTEGIEVNLTGTYSDKAIAAKWSLEDSTVITLGQEQIMIAGTGAEEADGVIRISAEGTYVFSGTLEQGQILVEAGEEENIQIVLNGVELSNAETAPIYVLSAKNVYLTLAEGTQNYIEDARAASVETSTQAASTEAKAADTASTDAANTDTASTDAEEELTAAIYSKADLFVNGTGALTVTGNYQDGITCKDDLKIIDGTLTVTAKDDGLVGKDSVCVRAGILTVEAGGDGIKSSNTEDTTKGNVIIDGGTLTITAGSDGVESVNVLVVNAGEITVLQSEEGMESLNIILNDGVITLTSTDDGINISDGSSTTTGMGEMPAGGGNPVKREFSADGQAAPEARELPADGQAAPEAGELPADGQAPTGEGGRKGGMGGNMGGGDFAAIDGALIVNGGTITVNAAGDGLDSNGDIQINGGNITVYGPTDGGNSALDYSGVCEINGGTFFLTGNGAMEQTSSQASTQKMISCNLSYAVAAGSVITISAEDGTKLYQFTAQKECRYVAFSGAECEAGTVLVITTEAETQSLTVQ